MKKMFTLMTIQLYGEAGTTDISVGAMHAATQRTKIPTA